MCFSYILLAILVFLILIFIMIITYSYIKNFENFNATSCIENCVKSHSEKGFNYPWLNNIHGGLKKIQFMEPPNSGKWNDYTEAIWETHCKIISHEPKDLVNAHVKAFINPNTRFAKLNFHFKDGTIMEPTIQFYELENDWFKKNGIC